MFLQKTFLKLVAVKKLIVIETLYCASNTSCLPWLVIYEMACLRLNITSVRLRYCNGTHSPQTPHNSKAEDKVPKAKFKIFRCFSFVNLASRFCIRFEITFFTVVCLLKHKLFAKLCNKP